MIHRSYYKYRSFEKEIKCIFINITKSSDKKYQDEQFYKVFHLIEKNWNYIQKYHPNKNYIKLMVSRLLHEAQSNDFLFNIPKKQYIRILKKYKPILGNEVINLISSF